MSGALACQTKHELVTYVTSESPFGMLISLTDNIPEQKILVPPPQRMLGRAIIRI